MANPTMLNNTSLPFSTYSSLTASVYSTPSTMTNSSLLAYAHADTRQQSEQEHVTFEPVFKHPAFVVGEQLRNLFDFFYSKLPTFSLPGAQASSVTTCAPGGCKTPTGSYEKSCHKPEVIYLSKEDQCELTTRCETIYEGLPHMKTSIRFAPGDSTLDLENNNGTLVVSRSREERVNAKLDELSKIALAPEDLVREQEAIIGTLKAGDVITVGTDLHPAVVSPEKWIKGNEAFSSFQRIAKATGGIMGHSPSSKSLNPLLEKMSAHILKAAESSESVDIAFVLDTTSSMDPYIGQVKNNLVQFLEQLRAKKMGGSRVALLEYRDRYDKFTKRVNTDFTSDLNEVQRAVRQLETAGGGDTPEAVLDGLLAARNELSWQPKAKRIVILIGDAPPHPTALDGVHDEAAVIDQYQTAGTQIAVYPIFSQNEIKEIVD